MSKNTNVKCPNCKEVFKVDDSVYTDIVKQVRDQEFENELKNRLELAENEKMSALKLTESELKSAFQKQLAEKEKEINDLKLKSKTELVDEVSKKEAQIRDLQSIIDNALIKKELELAKAMNGLEKERDQLLNDLKNKDTEKELLEKSLNEQFKHKLEHKDEAIKLKEEEINRLKDYKQKLSTKMIGETLEQHCETEFNKLRATAFQNAYFEKDNDASNGTKGDYIYKKTYKTQTDVIIPIHPQVKKILDKNDSSFPYKISDQKFNNYIKEVCKKVGLINLISGSKKVAIEHKGKKIYRKQLGNYPKYQLVSSHICRRSFATNFYGKTDTLTIMKITGHKTEKQFLDYIKTTSMEYAEKLKSIPMFQVS